ncbi:hypothetical protein AVEN_265276-1 [Araneus ventricosus]|uniref:Secreted protein n=1 Tax=Araneus ventricosus TaxID=182803 RepID=A0A4Y2JZ27_ARAVE|nr:hypothetical protein AVEN_265276-1 [Araneus ventricosus]
MTRYIHSSSLKGHLMACVLAIWQASSGTVEDDGNAEEFLYVGICEVFFGYERSACIPTQIRKSCTWSFVVRTRNLVSVCTFHVSPVFVRRILVNKQSFETR